MCACAVCKKLICLSLPETEADFQFDLAFSYKGFSSFNHLKYTKRLKNC